MAERSILVRLRANVDDFTRELHKAAGSLDELVKKSGDASGASQTAMGRLVQSATHQAEAWRAAGAGLLTVGTAITGVNALIAKTGIEYNTLQQKSRAALTTILGGAAEANAQMDKLDQFARTSPFAKQAFITAQQQMLAFGIEAEKVIPYLSAINDAVAAAGGNSQMLSEVAFVIAQIGAAGKITAQDLMQLGQRGINAAELIGSQMGKTGAEIRQSITKGALGANEALDALTAGMSERFAGASANVKNTMEGAFDRVKAAWRDLSASIMEPAVGQQGGGFLVGLTNSVADFLRGIEALPDPVKVAGGAVGGLAGAAALAAGGFMTLVPKLVEAHKAFQTLQATFPGIGTKAGIAGLAIAGATAVIGLAVSEMGRYAGEVDNYVNALKQGGQEAEKSARELHVQALAAENVGEALTNLGIAASAATEAALGDAEARQRIADAYEAEIQAIGRLIAAKIEAGEYAGDEMEMQRQLGEEQVRVLGLIDERARITREANEEEKRQREEMRALMGSDPEMQQQWAESVRAYHMETRGVLAETGDSYRELTEAEQKWLDTVVGASSGFIDHFAALEAAQQSYAERAAVNAGKSADAWKEFANSGKFSLADFAAELQKQVAAMDEWESNIIALHGRVSQQSIDFLIEMAQRNPELAAQAAKGMVDATEEGLAGIDPLLSRLGQQSGEAFNRTLSSTVGNSDLAAVMSALLRTGGEAAVAEASMALARGEATLADVVARYKLQAELRADTKPAEDQVAEFLQETDGESAEVEVDADTGPAKSATSDVLGFINSSHGHIQVDANTSPAEAAARAALDRISRMSATVQVRAHHAAGFHAPVATGGHMSDVAAAYANRLAAGGQAVQMRPTGLLNGPGTTTSDSIPALVSVREFIQNAAATAYYGPDLLYAMNRLEIPREFFRAIGFQAGGSPSASPPAVAPVPLASMVSRASQTAIYNVTFGAGAFHISGLSGAAAAEDFVRQASAALEQLGS